MGLGRLRSGGRDWNVSPYPRRLLPLPPDLLHKRIAYAIEAMPRPIASP